MQYTQSKTVANICGSGIPRSKDKPREKLVITTRPGNLLVADSCLNEKKNGLKEKSIQTGGDIIVFRFLFWKFLYL